jgi:uncharacterized OB-fold protein
MLAADAALRPAATYFDNVAAGRLTYQRCAECAAAVFYPRLGCPACGGVRLRWEESAGAGTIYSASSLPQRDGSAIVVCLVDLDEGFRMMSVLVGASAPEIAIGARVQAAFERDSERPRVVFTPGAADA